MHRTRERAAARGWRSRLLLAACAAIVALSAGHAGTAAACTTGGSSCLPGSGYTLQPSPWSCGTIAAGVACYYNGTTSSSSAPSHTWGWGSAAYNAGGANVDLCVYGGTYFYGCGVNIARACYFTNCNDQNSVAFPIDVVNFSGRYQIFGNAKA